MGNKLSELKAAAAKYSAALKAHRENPTDHRALYAWDAATTEFYSAIGRNEMEIIPALLEELEAKDKRIAELEEQKAMWVSVAKELGSKCDTLEAKLAKPVRLLDTTHPRCRLQHGDDIRAAGFKVEVDE
ncbi:TPA: hypothetical protein R4193_002816 [Serratia marcescens]|uniref:hypothetical protein n=1 Tax=Serratia marcescens TaxID=615 RepID=UPI001C41C481|nr:hypothetical protein [Serratia marcescens]EGT0502860.1 hypothetical protein [Serratia marcescens]MDP8630500.1 hypothetical protein [Serratia marcescens]MDP8749332.1 hypothetical protein [Serratia marcescens]MDP8763639.1 hypothetical protein [Serratia marcescens]HBH7056194.1 hypothetical protein [Serratia marcescens]